MSNYLRMKGYIRNVSPTKRSSQGSFPYFNFLLQVNSKQTHRAVCYDPTKQKLLKRYQESKEPVTLGNIAKKKKSSETFSETANCHEEVNNRTCKYQ